jgi:hypothetical protein
METAMNARTIDFRDCPPSVCNHYDTGPSAQRVRRAQIRTLGKVHSGQREYVITHTYGKDYWRMNKWEEWYIHKSIN